MPIKPTLGKPIQIKVIQCQLQATRGNYREIQATYSVYQLWAGNLDSNPKESGSNSNKPEEITPKQSFRYQMEKNHAGANSKELSTAGY